MFAASSRLRFAVALIASAFVLTGATVGRAQSIDFSLNVFYSNPTNPASGGTWELIAKSSPSPATFGIAGITANLTNINSDAALEAPRATVNGSNAAGFRLLSDTPHSASSPNPAYREIVVAQVPLIPLPPASEQNLFYGVGTLTNGAPGLIGPAFTSLTNPQDIPWAATPDAFGDAAWNTAARFLSGTFAAGATPAFLTGTTGNVFTSAPATNNAIGNTALASAITAIVRTNAVQVSADYNQNGVVDAADYVLWRKTEGQSAVPPGSGADGNNDGTINLADYTLWRANFGAGGGPGSGSDLAGSTIPEPATGFLLTMGAVLISARRKARFQP